MKHNHKYKIKINKKIHPSHFLDLIHMRQVSVSPEEYKNLFLFATRTLQIDLSHIADSIQLFEDKTKEEDLQKQSLMGPPIQVL